MFVFTAGVISLLDSLHQFEEHLDTTVHQYSYHKHHHHHDRSEEHGYPDHSHGQDASLNPLHVDSQIHFHLPYHISLDTREQKNNLSTRIAQVGNAELEWGNNFKITVCQGNEENSDHECAPEEFIILLSQLPPPLPALHC